MEKIKITSNNFNHINSKISLKIKEKIKELNLDYSYLSEKENELLVIDILKYLLKPKVVFSGKHRKKDWEEGWKHNLLQFKKNKNLSSLIPKYFDKFKFHRISSKFVKSQSRNFEYKLVCMLQYVIFDKYFKNQKNIYEFGAGTGHNLIRLREINHKANLFSFEWANSGNEIIEVYKKISNDKHIFAYNFDNFNPNHRIKIKKNASIFTFASLEQLGTNYRNIVDYWIQNRPKLIVNIEPMSEFLNPKKIPEYLSLEYFKKRNYLKNYFKYLKLLEKNNKIIIVDKIKTGLGSKFIEGYSIVAWKPI